MGLKKLVLVVLGVFLGLPLLASLPVALIGLFYGNLLSSARVLSIFLLLGGGALTLLRRDIILEPEAASEVAADGGTQNFVARVKSHIREQYIETGQFRKVELGTYGLGGLMSFAVVLLQ